MTIESPWDDMPRWYWVPLAVLRAIGPSIVGLLGSVKPGPSATVVVRRNRSVYRRFVVNNLDDAAVLAGRLNAELRTHTGDEFLRRNPSWRK